MKYVLALASTLGLLAFTSPVGAQTAREKADEAKQVAAEAEALVDQAYVEHNYEAEHPSNPYPIIFAYEAISMDEYPAEAWREDMEGIVQYELAVDPKGVPTGCTITISTEYKLLDDLTCKLVMERQRFEPATDADGNAVAGVYVGDFAWEKREPEFPGSFVIKVQFTIDENGDVQNCETLEMSGDISAGMRQSFARRPCPSSPNGAPYRDADGNPVARELTLEIKVDVTEPAQ